MYYIMLGLKKKMVGIICWRCQKQSTSNERCTSIAQILLF